MTSSLPILSLISLDTVNSSNAMTTANSSILNNGFEPNTSTTPLTTLQASMAFVEPPIAFWFFLAIESLLIIMGNGMLCWIFFSRRQLRTQQNFFVLSLSISDFLVGLTIAPCEYCALSNSDSCSLFCGSVLSFNMLASTINLILIAADRYYSIMCPFRYQELVSKRRAKIIIFIGWITTLLLVLLPFSWAINPNVSATDRQQINLIYIITLFVVVILIGILLGISYYTIVRTVQHKLKEFKEKSSNPAGIKVCIMVAISFFVCWIPTCIIELMISSNSQYNPSKSVMNASYFIFLINPCLDPMMYAYYRHDFRHELATWRRRRWKGAKKIYDRVFLTINDRERMRLNNNFEFKEALKNVPNSTIETSALNT